MVVYLILIFILLILGLGLKCDYSKRGRKSFLIISFLILTGLSGFRAYSVGVDTSSYVVMFNNIDYINFLQSRYERGFLVFLKLIHTFTDNPTVFLMISSAICVGAVCCFIYKYSADPLFSILLYITLRAYFFQMTGIRQTLATALVMMAFSLLMERRSLRKNIISLMLLFLATQFHSMSIVAIIPYVILFFPRIRESIIVSPSWNCKIAIIVAGVSFIAYPLIMRLVTIVTPQYAHYFSGTWGESNYNAALFKMLIQLIFLIVGTIYLRNTEISNIEHFSMIMIFISLITETLSMRMEIWGRLTGMFSIYTGILYAPLFTANIKNGGNRIIVKSSIFAFSLLYLLITFIFRPEWDGAVPYILQWY